MKAIDSKKLMEIYLIEVGQNGRLDLIETIAQPDMIDEANRAFGGPAGRDGLTAHVKTFRRQIGELKLEIKQIVGNENEVMAHWFFTGIHKGPWLGREATGKEVSADVFSFFTLKEGLISYYRLWLCATLDIPVIFDSAQPNIKKL
jgi:predicted ester cyclase